MMVENFWALGRSAKAGRPRRLAAISCTLYLMSWRPSILLGVFLLASYSVRFEWRAFRSRTARLFPGTVFRSFCRGIVARSYLLFSFGITC